MNLFLGWFGLIVAILDLVIAGWLGVSTVNSRTAGGHSDGSLSMSLLLPAVPFLASALAGFGLFPTKKPWLIGVTSHIALLAMCGSFVAVTLGDGQTPAYAFACVLSAAGGFLLIALGGGWLLPRAEAQLQHEREVLNRVGVKN